MSCRDAETPKVRAGRQAGFTLLEILVVIAILGLLIGLVAPAALRQFGGARVSIARQSVERLAAVLDIYQLDTGGYPSTDQGLGALIVRPTGAAAWNGPYLRSEEEAMDPWNRPWVYRSPSARGGRAYDLCSRGPDPNGAPDQMICNR